MVTTIILAAVAAAAFIGLIVVVLYVDKKRRFAEYVLDEVNKSKDALAGEYLKVVEKYERVQHGYDQGVLEGTRQGYVNVRAALADQLFLGGGLNPIELAKVRGFLVPLLTDLGQNETRILDKMKGNTQARSEFEKHLTDTDAINMFVGNNAPQRAVPVEREFKYTTAEGQTIALPGFKDTEEN